MISGAFDRLFGCQHRRMTRPITPVSKPGVPSGETYVVCLDCGKQFAYEWAHMRIGKPIERSTESGVLHPEAADRPKASQLAYALLGSAIPVALVVGKALFGRPARRQQTHPSTLGPLPDQWIMLPHGGPGTHFSLRDLTDAIARSGRDFIILGQVSSTLADHPQPSSLDYWLRQNYAKNKDVMQATDEVIARLLASGVFVKAEDLVCPDTGRRSVGLRLK